MPIRVASPRGRGPIPRPPPNDENYEEIVQDKSLPRGQNICPVVRECGSVRDDHTDVASSPAHKAKHLYSFPVAGLPRGQPQTEHVVSDAEPPWSKPMPGADEFPEIKSDQLDMLARSIARHSVAADNHLGNNADSQTAHAA